MTARTLNKSIYLRADPDTVWDWLTDPEKLAVWFHKPPRPLTAGEDFEMFGTTSGERLIHGNVQRADRPSRLEYSFFLKPLGDHETRVVWTLDPVPGGTRLSLEHSGLPEAAEAFDLTLALDKGWDDHIGRMRAAIHDAA